MTFAEVPVGAYFEFEFTVYQRVEAEGLWNARCGDRWAQFEDNEVVQPSTYQPPLGWVHDQNLTRNA